MQCGVRARCSGLWASPRHRSAAHRAGLAPHSVPSAHPEPTRASVWPTCRIWTPSVQAIAQLYSGPMNRAAQPGQTNQPLEIAYGPRLNPLLPVEVLSRADVRRRAGRAELASRQRAHFHQLVLCCSGEGFHHVDFEQIKMQPGDLLHIHPGQVQEFQFDPHFDAHMVLYRSDLHRTFIPGQEWFPGNDLPTRWNLSPENYDVARNSIEELRDEQELFDGSPAYTLLLESLLAAFLARLHLLVGTPASATQLPAAYVGFRRYVEEHLLSRPTVTACAAALGYSTRTLDRACIEAVGQTAKHVLDERIAFEVRRLLTHTDSTITRIAGLFGFVDASGFSKFVQRHLGASPTDVRRDFLAAT